MSDETLRRSLAAWRSVHRRLDRDPRRRGPARRASCAASQAVPQLRVGDNFWYAMMTAHGLGAFVGWAAFAVMGIAWWVLCRRRLPDTRLRARDGAADVVADGARRGRRRRHDDLHGLRRLVGLPLPAAVLRIGQLGRVGHRALLVLGAARRSCDRDLVLRDPAHGRRTGEALHAVKPGSIGNRLGLSIGWGYLIPKKFATNPKPVPYPVIPLAVIGLDMIIATLPLAGLLIWQIFQSIGWVGETNALLAKNILWWFGHPVVYLLLFPAVAAYYCLVPRYAGRELVAGHVIAVAWTVAVIANVFVWAHHIYIDYPERHRAGADQHRDAADHVLARAALGALALQPRVHDLPLEVHVDGCLDRDLPRARRLAARRALGHRQRDDRASTSWCTTRSGSSGTSTTWPCSTSAC